MAEHGYILFLLLIPNLEKQKAFYLTLDRVRDSMTEKIVQISKVTSNRQVTVPVEIMNKLNVKRGDKIIWIEENGKILVRKV